MRKVLYRYGGNRFSAYTSADGLPDHRVLAVPHARDTDLSAIAADTTGKLWVTTDDGLEMYDGKKWLRFRKDDGMLWNDCVSRSLRIEPDGSVWIGTSRGLGSARRQKGACPSRRQ